MSAPKNIVSLSTNATTPKTLLGTNGRRVAGCVTSDELTDRADTLLVINENPYRDYPHHDQHLHHGAQRIQPRSVRDRDFPNSGRLVS